MASTKSRTIGKGKSIYQLKITLVGSKPPIWRRLLVPGSVTLETLHDIIQVAMGWTESHLHQFIVGDVYYSNPGFELDHAKDEDEFKLNQIAPREKKSFVYEYDFGDGWEHRVVVEKILPPEEGQSYPVCLKGKRACPPEDCGGIWGYAEFLEAISDPEHESHEEMLDWIGGDFDPEEFDPAAAN